jgi:phosphinothricin acetyltransferase
MTIRPAQPTDANAICAIWNAVIEHTNITFTTIHKTQAEVKTLISDRGAAFIVATDNDRLIGFATYGAFRSGPGYKDVVEHSVYVDGTRHGGGLGQSLITELEQVARQERKRIMIAAITGDNAKARAFHAKQGFTQVAYMPEVGQKFGRLHDLCIMQKNL